MLQLDITDPASVANAISTILKEQGSIDVLVNNAGMGISGAIELTTEEEIQHQMNTNSRVPSVCVRWCCLSCAKQDTDES